MPACGTIQSTRRGTLKARDFTIAFYSNNNKRVRIKKKSASILHFTYFSLMQNANCTRIEIAQSEIYPRHAPEFVPASPGLTHRPFSRNGDSSPSPEGAAAISLFIFLRAFRKRKKERQKIEKFRVAHEWRNLAGSCACVFRPRRQLRRFQEKKNKIKWASSR